MDKLLIFSKEEKLPEEFFISVVKVWGTLDETTVPQFRDHLLELCNQGYKYIILKISGLKDNGHLLAHTLENICEKVGYEDNPSFRKTFKKFIGMSPRDYRKKFARLKVPA